MIYSNDAKWSIMYQKEKNNINIIREFSRFASSYSKYNIIQEKVAKKLVESVSKDKYATVIDIGCGSGQVYKELKKSKINIEKFTAMDASWAMLNLHANDTSVEKVCLDFNNAKDMQDLSSHKYSLLLSSSSLQWCSDLNATLVSLSKIADEYRLAIFTAGTFQTLHQAASISSPIHSKESIIKTISKYFDAQLETINYTLEFDTTKELFEYIKKSGVSGGGAKLSYSQTKRLMQDYSAKRLEFEVVFVKATQKKL